MFCTFKFINKKGVGLNGYNIKERIYFDDVLLIPNKSEVLPKDVLLNTNLTKNKIKYTINKCRYGYCYRI